MRIVILISFLLTVGCRNYAYLGQQPPKDTPTVFDPGIISLPDRKEEVITFSPNLKEIYFSIEFYPEPKPSFTMFMNFNSNTLLIYVLRIKEISLYLS